MLIHLLNYEVIATVTDTAGNVSTDTTSNELTVDNTAPTDVRSWLRVNGISYRIGANYRIPAVKAGDTVIVHANLQ